MRSSVGSSLSEILIALSISSFMLLVMGQSYVSIKNHYIWQEKKLSETQESLLLLDWLKGQIQTAGMLGCRHQSALQLEAGVYLPKNQGLLILERDDPILPKAVRRHAVKGSSILFLTRMVKPIVAIDQSQQNSELITLMGPTPLKVGQDIIVSDCQHAFGAKVNSISPSKFRLTLSRQLIRQYGNNAVIGALSKSIIYIRKVGKESALYISDGKRSEELVRNIINLRATKQSDKDKSLIYVELQRFKLPVLSLYGVMYGQ